MATRGRVRMAWRGFLLGIRRDLEWMHEIFPVLAVRQRKPEAPWKPGGLEGGKAMAKRDRCWILASLALGLMMQPASLDAGERAHGGKMHAGEAALYGSPAIGRKLFAKKQCSACHAIRGKGTGSGPDLSAMSHDHNVIRMSAILWNHAVSLLKEAPKGVASWPRLSGEELAHLIAYLHSPQVLGDPREGNEVFDRRGCVRCHAVRGEGARVGPDLVSGPHPHTGLDFAAAMWSHAPVMVPLMGALKAPDPLLERGEMADLLAYLEQAGREHHPGR